MNSETKICQNCKKDFAIEPEDFSFYEKIKVPPPTWCPNCRHYQRVLNRNPNKLWHRQCVCDKKHAHHAGNCEVEFETSYSPDRPEIVYCEKCYQQEVY
ncbi:MAG: hypothetical protein UU24_C0008G0015 [Candidatus Nomurabacteria bacterium GW2011_GWA2_40_9]|uniref:Uncharacterized protein n=1 Tax=Candidatus Nomurabacteria bacterium GW2011_GWA2_40_9 TaxID=1618734 RepID=A0A0G0WVK5_9BACT|nr:MAG: hypothetical protein UU24_C0008G0015 [Candidatus Nomurabacteria bacterium GW2011_GWA2_40_9]